MLHPLNDLTDGFRQVIMHRLSVLGINHPFMDLVRTFFGGKEGMGVADVESGFPTNPEEIRKLTGLPAEASNQLSRDISNYLSERICLLRQGVVEEKEKLIGENE